MPQLPFSEVPTGDTFLAPISILGQQDLIHKKASPHEAIPVLTFENGEPIFDSQDADSFNPDEVVTWPPSDIWSG